MKNQLNYYNSGQPKSILSSKYVTLVSGILILGLFIFSFIRL
jgi:hypothetical protein